MIKALEFTPLMTTKRILGMLVRFQLGKWSESNPMYRCVPCLALSYALPDIADSALYIVKMPEGAASVHHRVDDRGTFLCLALGALLAL